MNKYKIISKDRMYNEVEYYHMKTMTIAKNKALYDNINPIQHRLFSNDVFYYDEETHQVTLFHSTVRVTIIPGILVLEGNRTYGRYQNNKLLYKCIPDDKRLPVFLVPYKINQQTFRKNIVNQYVIFECKEWTPRQKHPIGSLKNTLGPISNVSHFYEYQLYCKSLYDSIKPFNNTTRRKLKEEGEETYIDKILNTYTNIEDRHKTHHVFSIDPTHSLDFDDAFSIQERFIEAEPTTPTSTKIPNGYVVSIYIANVPLWLEILDVWDSFTNRIATIYLPDRKRPMLPTILSDSLCSLQEGQRRFAFCIDVYLTNDATIEKIEYCNTMVQLYKNYRYDEPSLEEDVHYQTLFQTITNLSQQHNYLIPIRNSHDIVGYLMILMNHQCAMKMTEYKNGIYRSIKYTNVSSKSSSSSSSKKELCMENSMPETLDEEVRKFIKVWKSVTGQYTLFDNIQSHDMISKQGLDVYLHTTSPIRRLVDLINISKLQINMKLITFGKSYHAFEEKWTNKLEYINQTMRAIRKVQCDCSLLDLCMKQPDTMNIMYEGCMFDRMMRNDGLFQYMVYIHSIKMLARITYKEEIENYTMRQFKLFVFTDESTLKRKIRIQLIV